MMAPAVPWGDNPAEFLRVTETQLAQAVAIGAFTNVDLPYHYPLHAEGMCEGCDARRVRRDAMIVLHGAA